MQYVVTILCSNGSPNPLTWKFKQIELALYYKNFCIVIVLKKRLHAIGIPVLLHLCFSIFQPQVMLSLSLYFEELIYT